MYLGETCPRLDDAGGSQSVTYWSSKLLGILCQEAPVLIVEAFMSYFTWRTHGSVNFV